MAGETLGEVIRRLGRSGALQGDLAQTDAQLLARFVRRRDEPAFAALMARHGPMVFGLCRRLLADAPDAEDAFQASFLILARKAAVIRRQALLGPWLYGVAWRVAVRLRGRAARRRERERAGLDLDSLPADDVAWSEARWVVHEEVQRLPKVYRSAVILCCLEGKTNEQAALLLRRPVGTVKSRLRRARELLRTRLTRRGMAVSVGALGTALAPHAAPAPATLVNATVRAALPFAAGGPMAAGVVSARAAALSQGVLRTMMLKKVTFAAALVLVVALIGGVGGLAYRAWAAAPGDDPKTQTPAEDKPAAADAPKDDRKAIQGTWKVASIVVNGKEWDDDEGRKQKTAIWTITDDKIIVQIDAPPRHETANYKYTLDPTQAPRTLDVNPWDRAADVKGKTIPELYSLEGDTLKICNGLAPNAERPKEIASKEGSQTVLFTLNRVPPEKDKAKDDREALQGAWQVESIEVGGKEATDPWADGQKKQQWVVKDGFLTVQPKGPNQVPHTETFVVRPDKNPKEIDIDPYPVGVFLESDVEKGIYALDGDVWKVCLPFSSTEVPKKEAPGRPKELATKDGSKTMLITLKRVKPDLDKPKEDKPTDDKQALEGTWQVVSVEVEGKEATGGRADQERKAEWVVKGQVIGLRSKDPNFVALSEIFAVRPDKNPKEIDINPYPIGAFVESDVDKGIYTLDGDVWKVCLAKWPMDTDDPPRPTEMATKKGDLKTVLITLKRVK